MFHVKHFVPFLAYHFCLKMFHVKHFMPKVDFFEKPKGFFVSRETFLIKRIVF